MTDPFDLPHDPGKRVEGRKFKEEIWPLFDRALDVLDQRNS
jgi:hypothetical protein